MQIPPLRYGMTSLRELAPVHLKPLHQHGKALVQTACTRTPRANRLHPAQISAHPYSHAFLWCKLYQAFDSRRDRDGRPRLPVAGCKKKAPEVTPTATTTTPPKEVKPPVVTAPPAVKAHLYDDDADPNKLIAAGLKQAKAQGKRVILDFGGDWCGDCQVLDIYMHREPNWSLLNNNFVVVHISGRSHR